MRYAAIGTILLLLGACQDAPPQAGSGQADDPATEASSATTPKVLLVGWDGVRPDILREVATPVFDALVTQGTFSETAETARPTVSGPCWSSILTGVWPEKHGVTSNDFSPNQYATYPDVFTLIESVSPELNTFAVADWLPLVSDEDGGPLISGAIDRKVILNGYGLGWLEADELSVDLAVEEIRNADPDFLFVYVGSPDEISHNIGGIGAEYRDAIGGQEPGALGCHHPGPGELRL